MLALLKTPAQYDAWVLKQAMKVHTHTHTHTQNIKNIDINDSNAQILSSFECI